MVGIKGNLRTRPVDPNILVPVGTFGIVTQGRGGNMATAGGRANPKMSGSVIRHHSSKFKAEALFNRMPVNLYNQSGALLGQPQLTLPHLSC